MVDHVEQAAARSGSAAGGPLEVEIITSDPDRTYRLSVADAVKLSPSDSAAGATPATATVHMPSESLVRLVYGRLDAEHTPKSVKADGVDLDALRSVFPGF